MAYHLRVTSSWDLIQSGLINEFLNKFKPTTYVFSEEVSDKGVIHVHGHLEYTLKPPPSSTLSDFFKRYLLSGKYYHQPLKKDIKNNLLYVLKDLDIKLHNLPEILYDSLIEETVAINDDKNRNTRDKLFELFKIWFENNKEQFIIKTINEVTLTEEITYPLISYWDCTITDLECIALFINDLYVVEWKKEPPLAHLNAYVIYIATLMNKHLNYVNFYKVTNFYRRRY